MGRTMLPGSPGAVSELNELVRSPVAVPVVVGMPLASISVLKVEVLVPLFDAVLVVMFC